VRAYRIGRKSPTLRASIPTDAIGATNFEMRRERGRMSR
jgi:hypothetical protein